MSQVILFAQQKGGAGKSTLLTQLAAWRAQGGARVVLIDLDPQRSSAQWFAVRQRRLGHGGGIELVESADWRVGTDIRAAARGADWVYVDAPGNADSLGRGAMRGADFAVVPCGPSLADVWATGATLEMLRAERLAHALALNRFPARGRAAGAAALALGRSGAPMLVQRVGARAGFADAFLLGAGVTETAPKSVAAREIAALAAEIDGCLPRR